MYIIPDRLKVTSNFILLEHGFNWIPRHAFVKYLLNDRSSIMIGFLFRVDAIATFMLVDLR